MTLIGGIKRARKQAGLLSSVAFRAVEDDEHGGREKEGRVHGERRTVSEDGTFVKHRSNDPAHPQPKHSARTRARQRAAIVAVFGQRREVRGCIAPKTLERLTAETTPWFAGRSAG